MGKLHEWKAEISGRIQGIWKSRRGRTSTSCGGLSLFDLNHDIDQFVLITKVVQQLNCNLYLLVVYIVFLIFLNQIVNKQSSGVHHSEKMRPIKYFIWLLWLLETNAELTLESVNRKVNDLEVEMTALKVLNIKSYHKVDSKWAQNVHYMGTSVG